MTRPRLNDNMGDYVATLKNKDRRVLIIGDLHEPFTLDGYFQHCKMIKDKYNCNEIVFIGDVIDSHFSSFHTTDPDGLGAGRELKFAIDRLKKWLRNKKGIISDDITVIKSDNEIEDYSLHYLMQLYADEQTNKALELVELTLRNDARIIDTTYVELQRNKTQEIINRLKTHLKLNDYEP